MAAPGVALDLVALSLGEWDHGADDAAGADEDLAREAAGLAALDALAAEVRRAGVPRAAALRATTWPGKAMGSTVNSTRRPTSMASTVSVIGRPRRRASTTPSIELRGA